MRVKYFPTTFVCASIIMRLKIQIYLFFHIFQRPTAATDAHTAFDDAIVMQKTLSFLNTFLL